jgi:hypothetical protein
MQKAPPTIATAIQKKRSERGGNALASALMTATERLTSAFTPAFYRISEWKARVMTSRGHGNAFQLSVSGKNHVHSRNN